MKNVRWLPVIFVLAAAMVLSYSPFNLTRADDRIYRLKFQGVYPPVHMNVKQVVMPWIEDVKDKSGGRLVIEYFPPNAIVKDKESYKAVESGVVDILSYGQGRNPGKFPLSDILELPFLFPNGETGSLVAWDLYEKYPEWREEYKGTRVLWHWVSATAQIATNNRPVKTLEDMSGLKIIGWSPTLQNLPKILGANPVNIPPMDTYLALERGVADGVHASYAAMGPFKLTEATKYVTEADTMVVPFYCVINRNSLKRLPEDLRGIILETTGREMSRRSGQSLDDGAKAGLEAIKKMGLEHFVLPAEERRRWEEKAMPLRETWLQSMEGKGYENIREIYKFVKEATEKY